MIERSASSGTEAGLTALAVSLRGVTKAYDNGVEALGPLDLAVRKGEFISLLGPSGCGKSTLIQAIEAALFGVTVVPGKKEHIPTWGQTTFGLELDVTESDGRWSARAR